MTENNGKENSTIESLTERIARLEKIIRKEESGIIDPTIEMWSERIVQIEDAIAENAQKVEVFAREKPIYAIGARTSGWNVPGICYGSR